MPLLPLFETVAVTTLLHAMIEPVIRTDSEIYLVSQHSANEVCLSQSFDPLSSPEGATLCDSEHRLLLDVAGLSTKLMEGANKSVGYVVITPDGSVLNRLPNDRDEALGYSAGRLLLYRFDRADHKLDISKPLDRDVLNDRGRFGYAGQDSFPLFTPIVYGILHNENRAGKSSEAFKVDLWTELSLRRRVDCWRFH